MKGASCGILKEMWGGRCVLDRLLAILLVRHTGCRTNGKKIGRKGMAEARTVLETERKIGKKGVTILMLTGGEIGGG